MPVLPELKTPIPGPRSLELGHRLRSCESRNVTFVSPDFPIFWERAAATNVWDVDGNRFLDMTSALTDSNMLCHQARSSSRTTRVNFVPPSSASKSHVKIGPLATSLVSPAKRTFA